MRRYQRGLLWITAAMSLAGECHGTLRELEDYQGKYRRELQRMEGEHLQALNAAAERYAAGLRELHNRAQGQGRLEELLAIGRERERFAAERSVPSSTEDGTVEVVAALQARYRMASAEAERVLHTGVAALLRHYLMALTALQQRLVKSDRVEDAVEVRAEFRQAEAWLACAWCMCVCVVTVMRGCVVTVTHRTLVERACAWCAW